MFERKQASFCLGYRLIGDQQRQQEESAFLPQGGEDREDRASPEAPSAAALGCGCCCCCCCVTSVMSDSVRPIDGSPPGSPIPGILQARTLEWVAISFSSA